MPGRGVIGYALARTIDARLTIAALQVAIHGRRPPKGCVHHSDRGSQYAAERYRKLLAEHGLTGSMGRRGNPYENAKAESFMKTLKVEAVYRWSMRPSQMSRRTCQSSSTRSTTRSGSIQLLATGLPFSSRITTPASWSKLRLDVVHPSGVTPCAGRIFPS
jgi:transposase InsO family protein